MYSRVPPPTEDQNDPKATTQDTDSEERGNKRPEGVSEPLWEKFQSLQKRRQEMTKRSTEKRIKNLQKQALQHVEAEMPTEEERSVLHSHQVALSESCNAEEAPTGVGRKRKLDAGDEGQSSSTEEKDTPLTGSGGNSSPGTSDTNKSSTGWSDVQPFLTVNDHLKGVDQGRYAPKSSLEQSVDDAVSKGEYKAAEELSDQLATRDFGKKIADAFDAKKYSEKQKTQDEAAKARKKKKLQWGFDHKQRWETKGNM